jgi:hypothetical protein
MKKTPFLLAGAIILILNACTPQAMVTSTPLPPTETAVPVETQPFNTVTPDGITRVEIKLAGIYVIDIPADYVVNEILSSPTTTDPIYSIETPEGTRFDIIVHPYTLSSTLVPGKCVASENYNAGVEAAPIFCEGLELTDYFTISGGWSVKYGSAINDLTFQCTANSPCPVDVPAETRYSISYVFVIPDESYNTILEFYVGDAFRGPSMEMDNFEGLGALLHDSIIPSLTLINP